MTTTSETGEFGDTTWWVDEDGGRARIDRRKGWPHYLVSCRGVTRIVEGDDFGRAHDAALAAIRATRGEAQPEGDGWEELRHNVWWWTRNEYNGSALMTGRGDWAWSLLRFGAPPAQGICETLDEAKRAVMDAARQSDDGRICTRCGTRYHKGIAHEQRCEAQLEPEPALSGQARIAAVERERDELRALLDEINREDLGPGEEHGCGSHSCVVERPRGMATNGGCNCSRGTLRRALRRERERTAAAVAAEREACAEIADDVSDSDVSGYASLGARDVAKAIRARKDGAR